jgi:hypothetical protein
MKPEKPLISLEVKYLIIFITVIFMVLAATRLFSADVMGYMVGIGAKPLDGNAAVKEKRLKSEIEIQLHSATVYKALHNEFKNIRGSTLALIIIIYGKDCLPSRPITPGVNFGWPPAPPATESCTIAENGEDFIVTIKGNDLTNHKVFINGEAVPGPR